MERDIIKEGQEELKRSLLMMNYDMKKTLSENTEVITEQSSDDYFKVRIQQILEYPEKIKVFTPVVGPTQIKAANVIKNAVTGLGTKFSDVNYSIDNGFKTLEELLGISKKYKESYGESLLDALSGEWFSGGETRVINKGVRLAKKLCNNPNKDSKYNEWCKVINPNKLKYGF